VVYRLRPKHVGQPQREKPINLISAPQSYPDFQAQRLLVPDDVSCAEASLLGDLTVQFLHFMQDVYPIMTCHQPVAATDPQQRLREAYSFLYRAVRPPPTWHPELTQAAQAQNLLGALAVGGPFAKLLICEDRETQTFTIDLRHMQAYPVREGLCRLGCKINFVAQDGRLTVANIVYNDETVSPGDKTWGITERIALCSLVTHLTVWRHGMQYHVAGLAPVAVVTHNLPPAHPIRRLLAVHIAETLSTNYYTHLTLRRSGFDVTGFSFPRDVIFRYYDDGAKAFALTSLDVRLDIAQRGMRETLWYPYASQALRYYDLFASYVSAYVQHYYPDDRALQADVDACAWFDMLDRSFVNSIRSYVPSLTKNNLIKFCTLFIYSVTVEHE